MQQKAIDEGWEYTAQQMGAVHVAQKGSAYVGQVDEAIQKLVEDMNALGGSKQAPDQLKGFVAEVWHADTFNINAALKGSSNRAEVEGSQGHASVDVSTNFGKSYGSKYMATAQASVNAQAKNVIQAYHKYLSGPRQGAPMSFEEYLVKYGYAQDDAIKGLIQAYRNSGAQDTMTLEEFIKLHTGEFDITTLLTSVYSGQSLLIPADQLQAAMDYLKEQIAKEGGKDGSNRGAVLANYMEVLQNLVDRISDGEGTVSKPLTKEEAEVIAALIKSGAFDPEDFGISLKSLVTTEYILQQALKAGYTAAVITVVLRLAPEIFKAIDYLIKNGELDVDQVKKIGMTAMSASAEGFLRGSIASALTISCQTGKLGEQFVSVSPQVIGVLTVIVLEVTKNSILVAVGKMEPREMGAAFAKSLIISSAALAVGTLGQMLTPELPVVGYMLGSLLGSCVASVVVGVGEQCLISFCVESGFTCFGLVKQNYVLPEAYLVEMGIDVIAISSVDVKKTQVEHTAIKHIEPKRINYHTIELFMVRRGVIGVNAIGYV